MMSPLSALSHDEIIDKYAMFTPNHTYWRGFTVEKFLSGFAFGYIFLREVSPIINFYLLKSEQIFSFRSGISMRDAL